MDLTDDGFLGGRLRLLQPARGHRAGHDALLLAALVPAAAGERAVDLGAGIGAAGLALARRVAGLAVTLVEIDAALAELARQNAARNRLDDRVVAVAADIRQAGRAAGPDTLPAGGFDHVLCNPPFNDPARHRASPDAARARAHVEDVPLADWVRAAARLLRDGGTLGLIHRADALGAALAALADGFGGIEIVPVHPAPGVAAIRVLARARKGSRAPLALLPALVLAGADGRPSPAAEAILRDGQPLAPPAA